MRDIKSAFPEKVIQYLVVTLPMFIFAVEQEPRWIVRAYQPETLLQCVFREWHSGYINIYRHVFFTSEAVTGIANDDNTDADTAGYDAAFPTDLIYWSIRHTFTLQIFGTMIYCIQRFVKKFSILTTLSDHLAFVCLLSNRRKLYCIFILYML